MNGKIKAAVAVLTVILFGWFFLTPRGQAFGGDTLQDWLLSNFARIYLPTDRFEYLVDGSVLVAASQGCRGYRAERTVVSEVMLFNKGFTQYVELAVVRSRTDEKLSELKAEGEENWCMKQQILLGSNVLKKR